MKLSDLFFVFALIVLGYFISAIFDGCTGCRIKYDTVSLDAPIGQGVWDFPEHYRKKNNADTAWIAEVDAKKRRVKVASRICND
jgi:hypothetical protein